MQAVNYSTARNNLKSLINEVCNNYEHLIITNKEGKNVVMMSLEEFNSIQEKLYILSSPKDSQEILKRVNDIDNNSLFQERKLI
jgi:antitoxin YefM